ncbi:MAG: glycosyltransferase family 4 protein [Candidatus Diapherotrites archaeon]|nr:glycosyltransferase family 4 protein [Candidatus Diapherotrites archaeon]
MKILHFTNRYWPALGGVEDVIDNLCTELQKKKIESDVLTLNRADKKKLKKFETKGKTKIFRIPFLDLKYYKVSTTPFSIIKNYDIIHIHSIGFFSDMILLTKFIHKKKIIISTNGGIFHTQNISGIKKLYFYIIERLLLKNADKIIAISKQDKKKFEQITKNVILIEPGFNSSEPKGKKEKNSFLRVGRFSKNKNVERLIDVFSEIKTNYKLRLVGRDFDNLLPQIKQKIKEKNLEEKIEILTDVNDSRLSKLYSKSEYFVSASKYEGFGIGGVECMHYNCKAILNSIPTYKEFVKKGSGQIVNFDGKDASLELSKAIKGKYDLAKAKKYADTFLWKEKINEFVKLYNSL